MEGVNQYLDQGVLGLTVFVLIGALVWTVRQWRKAEAEKDALHKARHEDVVEMVTLAVEVKNNIESLVKIVGERR